MWPDGTNRERRMKNGNLRFSMVFLALVIPAGLATWLSGARARLGNIYTQRADIMNVEEEDELEHVDKDLNVAVLETRLAPIGRPLT
jgi:hypothetical protein